MGVPARPVLFVTSNAGPDGRDAHPYPVGNWGGYLPVAVFRDGNFAAPCPLKPPSPGGRRPPPKWHHFPSNSSACASALFAVRSPSMRASSLTRAFRLAWIGSIVTTARSFDWSFVTTR